MSKSVWYRVNLFWTQPVYLLNMDLSLHHESHRPDVDLQSDSPTFSWTARSTPQHAPDRDDAAPRQPSPVQLHASLLPGQALSLSGISCRAFALGTTLGTTTTLTLQLAWVQNPLWRPPFFLAALALFHYLEFWTTARYNTRQASVSSFLLTSNGTAYNVAHAAALLECVSRTLIFPKTKWLPASAEVLLLSLGLTMIITGQATRSLAMVTAGSNFNHTVQTRRTAEHQLVTDGIYSYLRHPSYFGFFWWGLGTQLVLGNPICLVAYTLVLWQFFSRRIRSACFLSATDLMIMLMALQRKRYCSRPFSERIIKSTRPAPGPASRLSLKRRRLKEYVLDEKASKQHPSHQPGLHPQPSDLSRPVGCADAKSIQSTLQPLHHLRRMYSSSKRSLDTSFYQNILERGNIT